MIKNNTLLSVVTFPDDLFYPIGVHTVGIFVKKGTPHPNEQNVLWIRALNDGLLKSKGKRLPNDRATNDFIIIRDVLKAFLSNPLMTVENIEEFQKACPIDFKDSHLELIPEAYLDQKQLSVEIIQSELESIMRETASFLIKTGKE